ncbi:hypothetical protein VKS41_007012 [Umbelopsis sp. WA50703]
MSNQPLDLNGAWFYEPDTKRTVLLRGVNLSGGAKLPNGLPTHVKDGYWVDYDRNVNFIGRPMPLEEADVHLGRLKSWGFNFLRFVIIWEAIEHEGPGKYDYDYIDYIIQLLYKCKEYDFCVFIDPHQDCWSRHCGGSGAPGWTLPLVGLDPSAFDVTGAAIVQYTYPNPESFPAMIWSTNYGKLATSTMFTLFFGGKVFAPNCVVDGVNIQDYLQQHFINAVMQVVHRIHKEGSNKLENVLVVGYDTINEPNEGFIELADITKFRDKIDDLKKGWTPTAFQGFMLGSGIATEIEEWDMTWSGPKKQGKVSVDPNGVQAWLSKADRDKADGIFGWKRSPDWQPGCIWALHGVWDMADRKALIPNYFAVHPKTGEPIEFHQLWLQHIQDYAKAVREVHSEAILFVQPTVMSYPPEFPSDLKRLVYVPHWYDGMTLVQKTWKNYNVDVIGLKRGKYGTSPLKYVRALCIGEKSIRKCFQDQLGTMQHEGRDRVGEYPCLLGEIGIPYDMNRDTSSSTTFFSSTFIKTLLSYICLASFKEDDDEPSMNTPSSAQNRSMDACLNALEGNLLNYTLWTYLPDNSAKWGDLWNGEDMSLWQAAGDGSNARNIPAIHRPHPRCTTGIPQSIQSTLATEKQVATFKYTMIPNSDSKHATEIYIPEVYFPAKTTSVELTSGTWEVGESHDTYWILSWYPTWSETSCSIRLSGVAFTTALSH